MESKTTPILLRYGGAKKSSFEMNQDELEQAAISILQRAKEKAFSKGLPIYFSKHAKVYAEYADGSIKEIIKQA